MTWSGNIHFKDGKVDVEKTTVSGDLPESISVSGHHSDNNGGGISITANGLSASASHFQVVPGLKF